MQMFHLFLFFVLFFISAFSTHVHKLCTAFGRFIVGTFFASLNQKPIFFSLKLAQNLITDLVSPFLFFGVGIHHMVKMQDVICWLG
jgi:hypothetical protein